ncbi:MAG: prepilin-type N-terminal cleavage/methylation domain-containing protein [Planctomycetota bacterium]|nr:prepilin-type N-terminal cleavage/methylation domain-containing protein [Planctomycetota bacterium]
MLQVKSYRLQVRNYKNLKPVPRTGSRLIGITCNLQLITGFTLLEILIAVSIFVFLAIMMTSLLGRGLDLWKTSEGRGELSERAASILEVIKKDFYALFTEPDKRTIIINNFNQSLLLDLPYPIEPSFYSGIDKDGNQWLYFIRLDDDNFYNYVSPTYQKSLQRICYSLDTSTPTSPKVVRGVVDKNDAINFWEAGLETTGEIPPQQTIQYFEDVLYFGCDFTGTVVWDSRPSPPPLPPDPQFYQIIPQNIPETLYLTLDIKSLPLNAPKIKLENDGGGKLIINNARSLISAGDYIKVNQEWFRVQKKTLNRLEVSRQERGTAPGHHNRGDEVQYGETTGCLIYIPVAR